MKPGELWRHERFVDVDMYVLKVMRSGVHKILLKVKWLNRPYSKFFDSDDLVEIKRIDLKNWKIVE